MNPSSDKPPFLSDNKQNPLIKETFLNGLINKDGRLHVCVEHLEARIFRNSDITDLMIDGYGTIPASVFENCKKLNTVVIGNNIKEIGPKAFHGCTQLKQVLFLPTSSLETIDDSAFQKTGLKNIGIPDKVKTIGNNAFRNCKHLKFVDSSNTLEKIGDYAFEGCDILETIGLPKTILSVGEGAFANCPKLYVKIHTHIKLNKDVWGPGGSSKLKQISLLPYRGNTRRKSIVEKLANNWLMLKH